MENKNQDLNICPLRYPSVIDPACGDGIFLRVALEKGFTKPEYVWGVDIDDTVKEKLELINLFKSVLSKSKSDNHFFLQNGLLPLDKSRICSPEKGELREFDIVVGNPPFGGTGISFNKKTIGNYSKFLQQF